VVRFTSAAAPIAEYRITFRIRSPDYTFVGIETPPVDQQRTGLARSEFVRADSGRQGRQSHTWARIDSAWRIAAAHVSWFTPPPGRG
jgi:hypothetical protein